MNPTVMVTTKSLFLCMYVCMTICMYIIITVGIQDNHVFDNWLASTLVRQYIHCVVQRTLNCIIILYVIIATSHFHFGNSCQP